MVPQSDLGPTVVAPGVLRLTAPNPSPMTYTGTQTYVVTAADGRGPAVVIDPGPDHPGHRAAVLAALSEAPSAILVTHSHLDHTAGAPAFGAETGAPVLAFGPHGAGMSTRMRTLAEAAPALEGGEGADRDFVPDREMADGGVLDLGAWQVEALHTPGHLSNHLAFVLRDRGVVFTGDAVMGWSSTLVSPPEGDMAAQMRTLGRLSALVADLPGSRLMPGHGPVVENPVQLLEEQTAHRTARRRAVEEALQAGPASAETLAARLYMDTPAALLPAAARNVLATLLQLEEEGAATAEGALGIRARFRLGG
ncbi:MAG: MBL fold metallo-hydrolase [Pseudomonadota bacterium]